MHSRDLNFLMFSSKNISEELIRSDPLSFPEAPEGEVEIEKKCVGVHSGDDGKVENVEAFLLSFSFQVFPMCFLCSLPREEKDTFISVDIPVTRI